MAQSSDVPVGQHRHEHDDDGHSHASSGTGTSDGAFVAGQSGASRDAQRQGHGHSHLPGNTMAASTEEGLRVVAIATAGMFLVAGVELAIFAISQSAGLLSDALHNLGDVLTTAALWVAFLIARRPPTKRYTYGFSRAEDLAGAFIALVITVSAGAAAFESYRRLVTHAMPTQIGLGIAAALFGFVGNEVLAEYKIRAGRRLNSAPLVADGQHSRADGLTSLAAAVGLLLTWFGWRQADPIAGLLISVAILYILIDVGREVLHRLLDAVDPAIVDEVREHALSVPGVREVEDIRARWAGRQLYVALNLGADATMTLAQAHAIAERVRQEVLAHVAGAAKVDIHVDPVGLPEGVDPHAWTHEDHEEYEAHEAHEDHEHEDHDHSHEREGHAH
ncbi:MAG: cation diffusion facilitator family transporter [Ktedonobacterales bacterium]